MSVQVAMSHNAGSCEGRQCFQLQQQSKEVAPGWCHLLVFCRQKWRSHALMLSFAAACSHCVLPVATNAGRFYDNFDVHCNIYLAEEDFV